MRRKILVSSNTGLPAHGPISCRDCFLSGGNTMDVGNWRAVNDPCAWGSATPKVLILGFSKGFTQASAYQSGRFEDIPFKDMRPRLSAMLSALGILSSGEDVSSRMVGSETDLAFGSLVRCSLSRKGKNGQYSCTGEVMPKAFTEEISSVVARCAAKFLSSLPPTVCLVLMLGTTDSYIKGCRELVRKLNPAGYKSLNEVAYRSGGVTFVHVSHPSGLNGHHGKWMEGGSDTASGMKRMAADAAISQSV